MPRARTGFFCDLPDQRVGRARSHQIQNRPVPGTRSCSAKDSRRAECSFLCEGRAKLTVCSESGKRLTLHTAVPGEVLGLSAALSGTAHEVTAEVLDDAQIAMIKRKELLTFLREHREACLHVVDLLSQDLHIAYDRVRSVGLGRTRRQRAAPA